MTRTPFDQFAKEFFEEFLAPLGEVKTSYEVKGESRFIDIWFDPMTTQAPPTSEDLGILAQITTTACLLEPFRNQPTPTQIRNCRLKLYYVLAKLQRQAKRNQQTLNEELLPKLWIIAPSVSEDLISGFDISSDETWLDGFYFWSKYERTAIIALNKLPRTPETLWLRIFGQGIIAKQAVDEVIALPRDNPRRSQVLSMLANWKISIEASNEINDEDRETIMALSQAYIEWEKQAELRGQRQIVEKLLAARFGVLDEQLAAIVKPILELPDTEYASLLLHLSNLSREDLLARFAA